MEAPKAKEGILRFSVSEEARAEAAEYFNQHADLLESILSSDSAMEVRAHVLSHFGHSTELKPDPAPSLTILQQAVLVEGVDRWNKQRIADSQ